MQIELHASGLTLSDAIREHINRRVLYALSRLQGRIRRVAIHLSDINGPRGGIDKHCNVRVDLVEAPTTIIEESDKDVYVVLDRALARAGRTVSKRVERSHELLRFRQPWYGEGDLAQRQLRDRRRKLHVTRPYESD